MKPIVTGLAAYGMSGSLFHAPFIGINPGFELKCIVERTKNNAKERYPDIGIARSVDELLAIPEIELVVVNTPDVTHYEYTKKALLAGKHVVVEKPFVFTVKEGNELIELANEKSRVLCVFQNRRWDGDFLTIRKLLKSGVLGRVVEFSSSYQRYRNFIQQHTWKEVADNRVGITYNLGSHMVDQAVVLFGMPEAVYADIDKLREGSMVDDYYYIQLIYPKQKVSLRASYLVREETPRYYIHGTEGSFIKYGIDPQEDLLKAGVLPSQPDWGKEDKSSWGVLNANRNDLHFRGRVETLNGNYAGFYDEVYNTIRLGKSSSTAATRVIGVIRILEAAFESANGKKIVFL
ncbi:MAG: Gfo/Idh/MocA family oxidoreductase [Tannerella sp.]|jgi:predicted dehydrogenase|nr:Gfo/Idh/MocA family oxidoreductase [Tannerella sp.]